MPVSMTLSEFFGESNSAGLDGGSSAGNADTILVPSEGGFLTYYYKDAGLLGGTGWRSVASPIVDESSTVIAEPGKMFFLNRSGGNGFNLTEASPL